MAVSFSGRRAQEWPLSLDGVTGWLDPLVPLGSSRTGVPTTALHSLQVGLIAFTSGDLNERAPIPDDRPYASLLFLSGSRTYVSHPSEPVYGTSFTVGVLGTDAVEFVQRAIHKEFDFREVPEGWDHQVSDGGEPTFRFTWARQALLASNFQADRTEYELKWQLEASAGYLTEGSIALSGRWGAINTPWWSFTPERADYVSQPAPVIGSSVRDNRELYVRGGEARVRAYEGKSSR